MAVIESDVTGITFTPQSATIGALVEGADLPHELGDDEIAAIHRGRPRRRSTSTGRSTRTRSTP